MENWKNSFHCILKALVTMTLGENNHGFPRRSWKAKQWVLYGPASTPT